MVSSSTLVQLLTRFFLVLALIAVASSSARPHFGDTNQDEQEDTSSFQNYIKNIDRPKTSNVYYPTDDDYYYDIILPPWGGNRYRNGEDLPISSSSSDDDTDDDDDNSLNDETSLLRKIYKRVTNSRNSDVVYRRNGVDKKIKPKSPIRCLVNPVTCFK